MNLPCSVATAVVIGFLEDMRLQVSDYNMPTSAMP
jgi:hypothetical protein